MSRNICRILFFCLCLFCGIAVYGQDGAYGSFSPYSIYGIGNISKEGTAFNKSMGGVGIATRNRRFINILNPASLTARDSLSFMADFGLSEGNTVYLSIPCCGDILVDRGWALLHNPGRGIANVTCSETKPLTKAQKNFLYDYYMYRGLTQKAEEFLD